MPGWRMGFAVGNERLIAALARVKSYLDYGAFTPIQVAAAAALNGPQDCVEEMRQIYQSRRDVLVKSFAAAGWDVPPPPATMFAWVPIPEPFKALGSVEFSKLLIEKADVAVSPGTGFGEYGEGFVRIAIVENEHRIRQAARNIKRFLSQGTGRLAQRAASARPLRGRRHERGAISDADRHRRPRHGRSGGAGQSAPRMASGLPLVLGRRIEVTGVSARARKKDRGVSLDGIEWFDDPSKLAVSPTHRRVRRADRRRGRPGTAPPSRRRWLPASTSSPPTRRCSPGMAWSSPRPPRRRASRCCSRPRSPAAFPSSRRCARP